MLDSFLAGIIQEGTVVYGIGCLVILAVCDRVGHKWTVLRFERRKVSIRSELFHDILWHCKVNITLGIIPLEVDAAIEITNSIFDNIVSLGTKGILEVLEVVVANVFDAEVVNSEVEPDGAGIVAEEAGGVRLFVVAVFGQTFLE